MIDKNVQDAINQQINAELFSSYLYESMAAFADSLQFEGFAHWFRVQADEEKGHARKFIKHISDRNGKVNFSKITEPSQDFISITDLFERTYSHELVVSKKINDLSKLIHDSNDFQAYQLINEFAEEQTEEENMVLTILSKLRLGDPAVLIELDEHAGERK